MENEDPHGLLSSKLHYAVMQARSENVQAIASSSMMRALLYTVKASNPCLGPGPEKNEKLPRDVIRNSIASSVIRISPSSQTRPALDHQPPGRLLSQIGPAQDPCSSFHQDMGRLP